MLSALWNEPLVHQCGGFAKEVTLRTILIRGKHGLYEIEGFPFLRLIYELS